MSLATIPKLRRPCELPCEPPPSSGRKTVSVVTSVAPVGGTPTKRPLKKRMTFTSIALSSTDAYESAIDRRLSDRKVPGGFESLDYDEAENRLVKAASVLPAADRARLHRHKELLTFLLIGIVGLLVGSAAYLGSFVVEKVVAYKVGLVREALTRGRPGEAWVVLSAFVLALVVAASMLTRHAPEAAGSGIPHVKGYLNGNKLDGALRPRTLVAKLVGICCCVATGMPAGREGPMVHSGAVIAALVGTSPWTADVTHRWLGIDMNNDFDRRNFVSIGAAAGVAAAFHAPIGGILFSLEEVSSFWDPRLTLLTFMAVCFAALTVAFWSGGMHGQFDDHALVLFARQEPTGARSKYRLWEVGVFMLLSVGCGLLGAAFNEFNKRLTILRKRRIGSRPNVRAVEAVLVVWLTISLLFLLCFAFPCTSWRAVVVDANGTAGFAGSTFEGHVDGHGQLLKTKHSLHLIEWECAPSPASSAPSSHGSHGSHGLPSSYNEMATLLMQGQESAIMQLYSRGTAGYFSPLTLAVFALVYFCATCLVYGVSLPSGLFVPCMLIGGGIGRLVGELLHEAGAQSDPGAYALVGAAGFLGGVTRMTMSLACIVIEVSNDIDMVLPIMIAVGIAKQVGDAFNSSLYDIHIGLSGVPMLGIEWVLPDKSSFGKLNAKSIMHANVTCLPEAMSPTRIEHVLRTTTHGSYPIITHDHSGSLRLFNGLISRAQLESILEIESEKKLQREAEAAARDSIQEQSPAPAPTPAPAAAGGGGPGPLVRCPTAAEIAAALSALPVSLDPEADAGGKGAAGSSAQSSLPIELAPAPASGASSAEPQRRRRFSRECFDRICPRSHSKGTAAAPAPSSSTPLPPGLSPAFALSPAYSPALQRRSHGAPDERDRSSSAGYKASPMSERRSSRERGASMLEHGAGSSRSHCSASAAGLVDLRPHCDRSPYVVHELLPLRRVFRLFETMGLRSLVVVDAHSCVVGIITRKDFLKIGSSASLHHKAMQSRRQDSIRRYMEQGNRELALLSGKKKSPTKPEAASSSSVFGVAAASAATPGKALMRVLSRSISGASSHASSLSNSTDKLPTMPPPNVSAPGSPKGSSPSNSRGETFKKSNRSSPESACKKRMADGGIGTSADAPSPCESGSLAEGSSPLFRRAASSAVGFFSGTRGCVPSPAPSSNGTTQGASAKSSPKLASQTSPVFGAAKVPSQCLPATSLAPVAPAEGISREATPEAAHSSAPEQIRCADASASRV